MQTSFTLSAHAQMKVVMAYQCFERFGVDGENAVKKVVWTGSVFRENASSKTHRVENALVWTGPENKQGCKRQNLPLFLGRAARRSPLKFILQIETDFRLVSRHRNKREIRLR